MGCLPGGYVCGAAFMFHKAQLQHISTNTAKNQQKNKAVTSSMKQCLWLQISPHLLCAALKLILYLRLWPAQPIWVTALKDLPLHYCFHSFHLYHCTRPASGGCSTDQFYTDIYHIILHKRNWGALSAVIQYVQRKVWPLSVKLFSNPVALEQKITSYSLWLWWLGQGLWCSK